MTLNENASPKTLEYFAELRSLKIIGKTQWISLIIKSIPHVNIKLDQLTVITSAVKSLSEILIPVLSIRSLRRLEMHTDEFMDNVEVLPLLATTSNIEQFIVDSSSMIDWTRLSNVQISLIQCHYLSVGLIHRNQKSLPSFSLHNLRTLCIALHELPFNCIIQLVETTPCLVKLKITGLVDADGFLTNQRWICLLETTSSLSRVLVRTSLEQSDESYYCEEVQAPLRALNLSLICDSDDTDCFSYYGTVNRWWSLRGTIIRQTCCV